AAACFYRSSQRFYNWVISHKLFGNHVKNYREGKGMRNERKLWHSFSCGDLFYLLCCLGFQIIFFGSRL
ncbi:MAG: DUF454 family protein, partial [Candidatus Marinimicrobia bacterium]|nr:DUF454 family protein [Candidatus Neomarinimicrobiota bacterium]